MEESPAGVGLNEQTEARRRLFARELCTFSLQMHSLTHTHRQKGGRAERERESTYFGVLRPVNQYGYIRERERERK